MNDVLEVVCGEMEALGHLWKLPVELEKEG